MKNMKAKICAILIALVVMCGVPAGADMLIMPVRVYFKDGERLKGLTTMNTSDVQAIYRLKYQYTRQNPNGSYTILPGAENPALDPGKWLVYSPRQVDLEPQGKQGIKLSLRRPADLPDGEYRVHALLERIARDRIEGHDQKGAAARMMINVGFAVPVIIRVGKYDAAAKINGIKLVQPDLKKKGDQQKVEVSLHRTGKYSTIGQLNVFWTPPGGQEVQVVKKKSLIIYPEVTDRVQLVPLSQPVSGGTLRLVYSGMEADNGIVFDERSFPLQ